MEYLKRIWKFLNKKSTFFIGLFFAMYLLGNKADDYSGLTKDSKKQDEALVSDGAAYYAYLPQWFIYKTKNFEYINWLQVKYKGLETTKCRNLAFQDKRELYFNKYYIGTPILLSPFFLAGHAYANQFGYDPDGFSKPYIVAVQLGLLFYVLLGCLGIRKLLLHYKIDSFIILVSLLMLLFGTDLCYYSYVVITFSHPFSFAIAPWCIYAMILWAKTNDKKQLIYLSFLLGLLFIIRPTNVILVLILPFLFSSTKLFVQRIVELFKKRFVLLLGVVITLAALPCLQFYSVYHQWGSLKIYQYQNEYFEYLNNPKIIEVLFGYTKGLFLYAPVLVLFFPGMFVLWKTNRRLFYGIALFFVFYTYIISSWWCWWYGGGLGMRCFIDVFVVMIIPIALLLQKVATKWKVVILLYAFLSCWVYMIFEFQMRKNILSWKIISPDQFYSVFMQTDGRFNWSLHLKFDKIPTKFKHNASVYNFHNSQGLIGKEETVTCKTDTYSDDLSLTLTPTLFEQNDRLKFTFYTKASIKSGEMNPSINAHYYKADSIIASKQFMFGAKIPKVNAFTAIQLDFYSKLRGKDVDSVRIYLDEAGETTFKETYIKVYR